MAGGPQPYSGALKNVMLSPAATDLGFADGLKQQVEDIMAVTKKKQADSAPGGPYADITQSLAAQTLFPLKPSNG